MAFILWMQLGLCSGFVRNDDELTMRLCESEFASKFRHIDPPYLDLGFGLSGTHGYDRKKPSLSPLSIRHSVLQPVSAPLKVSAGE